MQREDGTPQLSTKLEGSSEGPKLEPMDAKGPGIQGMQPLELLAGKTLTMWCHTILSCLWMRAL